MSNDKNKKKLSTLSLVLIIIATEFGFSNIVTGYNQMGYASIIWYLFCALIYLFPLAMIFAEYSGSIKNDHGGFYSWLINSVGEKWAFIGTFMWVGLMVINILQIASGLGINFSGLIFGKDTTQSWQLGFLNSNEIEAILGIIFILFTTFLATKGVRKIAITATIGGIVSMSIVFIFIIASIIIFFVQGHLAQPITGVSSFIKSPSPQFQSPVAIISFAVYAMYAYGGIETSSGLLDKMKNPRRDYPQAMIIVSIVMALLYVLGIFVCGLATNWAQVMGQKNINLYNNSFYLFGNIGVELVKAFGGSNAAGQLLGVVLVRLLSFGMLVPVVGLLIVGIYSPIKGLIAGSSKDLWPKKVAHFNKHDMPAHAMWIECIIIIIALILIAMTGKNGQQFFQIIVNMGNIGVLAPYYFIVIAFVFFKKRKDIAHPITFFHSMKLTYFVVGVLLTAMTLAAIFNLWSPILQKQYAVAFWTFAGPVLFFVISALMYHLGIHTRAKRMIADNEAYERANK